MSDTNIALLVDEQHPLIPELIRAITSAGARARAVHWRELAFEIDRTGRVTDPTLADVDAVYLDRLAEEERCYATQFRLLEKWSLTHSVAIINPPDSYWPARDKALSAMMLGSNGIPTPPTHVCHDLGALRTAVHTPSVVVVKSTQGFCAREILIGEGRDIEDDALASLLECDGAAVVQPFIDNPARFVWRIDVVDGQVIVIRREYAVNASGPPLCNGDRGGVVEFVDQHEEVAYEPAQLAIRAAALLRIPVAGVDIAVDGNGQLFVLEVNPEPDLPTDGEKIRNEFPEAIARCLLTSVQNTSWKGNDET